MYVRINKATLRKQPVTYSSNANGAKIRRRLQLSKTVSNIIVLNAFDRYVVANEL